MSMINHLKNFSKKDLEHIFSSYQFCLQAHDNLPNRDDLNIKFSQIVEDAEFYIQDFANGNLIVDADALDLMLAYIEEFGKSYYHHDGKLVYEYSSEAVKAKTRIAKLRYFSKTAETQKKSEPLMQTHRKPIVTEKSVIAAPKTKILFPASDYSLKVALKKTCATLAIKLKKLNPAHKISTVAVIKNWFNLQPVKAKCATLSQKIQNCGNDFLLKMKKQARSCGLASLALVGMSTLTTTSNSSVCEMKTPVEKVVPIQNIKTQSIDTTNIYYPLLHQAQKLASTHSFILTDCLKNKQNSVAQKSDICVSPYKAEYSGVLQQNKHDYRQFAQQVTKQFLQNIALLNKATYREKIKFYKEQGQYFAEIGKSKYIVPSKSCESMSNATLLSVVAKNKQEDNFINEACENILKKIPNPHACASSSGSLKTKKTNNLGKEICHIFEQNPNAIIAAWIHNSKGGQHRISFVGTGDGKAYMMAYNNDRVIEIDENHLGWLNYMPAKFSNLSEDIIEEANEMAIESVEQHKINQSSLAQWKNNWLAARI